jgi:hypothetical protein
VGFESTIPVFKRTAIVHDLDRAATVIGLNVAHCHKNGSQEVVNMLSFVRYPLLLLNARHGHTHF